MNSHGPVQEVERALGAIALAETADPSAFSGRGSPTKRAEVPTSPRLRRAGSPLHLLDELTPAERLVATHVLQGLSNKEIAAVLGKSESTVKAQVSSILRAYDQPSRSRFIAFFHGQSHS